jgi:hypothetical protein
MQPQEEKMHKIALTLESPQECKVRPSGESLETEIHTLLCVAPDFIQHQATRANGRGFGRKRRNSLGDKISIHEVSALGIMRQELAGERGFSGTIRPCDDVDTSTHFPRLISKFVMRDLVTAICEWSRKGLQIASTAQASGIIFAGGSF